MAFPSIWGAPFAINPVSQVLAREIALKRGCCTHQVTELFTKFVLKQEKNAGTIRK
jgi:hypothetical protein